MTVSIKYPHLVQKVRECDIQVPQIRFEESEYTVPEDAGTVSICVELLVGGVPVSSASALVQSQSGGAIGN